MTEPTAITDGVPVGGRPAKRTNARVAFRLRAGHYRAPDRCVTSPRPGFTLVELLVVILVISIISGLLLTAVSSVRRSARSVECLSNLRQLALVFRSYAETHHRRFPSAEGEEWFIQIARHGQLPQFYFQCPDDPDADAITYQWRDDSQTVSAASLAGKRIDMVANSDLILVFDSAPGWHSPDYLNAATVGGTAKSYASEEFQENLLRSFTTGEAFYLSP